MLARFTAQLGCRSAVRAACSVRYRLRLDLYAEQEFRQQRTGPMRVFAKVIRLFVFNLQKSYDFCYNLKADNVQAKSYKLFCKRYSPADGFKISMKNIGQNITENTNTTNLPLYLLWELEHYIKGNRE